MWFEECLTWYDDIMHDVMWCDMMRCNMMWVPRCRSKVEEPRSMYSVVQTSVQRQNGQTFWESQGQNPSQSCGQTKLKPRANPFYQGLTSKYFSFSDLFKVWLLEIWSKFSNEVRHCVRLWSDRGLESSWTWVWLLIQFVWFPRFFASNLGQTFGWKGPTFPDLGQTSPRQTEVWPRSDLKFDRGLTLRACSVIRLTDLTSNLRGLTSRKQVKPREYESNLGQTALKPRSDRGLRKFGQPKFFARTFAPCSTAICHKRGF